MASRPLTIGTAGHIDHGKTALVAALTGRDTDRLAEEKRRGISIELGFAELDLGERRLSLVDVPGHERFVRTMIAGASGIDLFLLVVAADDGPMPQTREHMAVLRALGVERGVLALTKCDLVEAEARRLALEDCETLAPELSPIEVSARSGEGIEALRAELARLAASLPERPAADDEAAPLLHVDRVFTIAGHGTVVTGTLWSGRLRRGQEVLLLPGGTKARVRGIEVHDRRLESAAAGRRVAVNLRGVGRDEVERGDALTVPGGEARTTFRLDLEPGDGAGAIAAERRVQAHLGTRDAPARVVDLGDGALQLRLERPLIAREGDRVVIRRIAPPDTLGGGRIVDPSPRRHGRELERGRGSSRRPAQTSTARRGTERQPPQPAEPSALALRLLAELREDGLRPRGAAALAAAVGVERREAERALTELVAAGELVRLKRDVLYPSDRYAEIRRTILAQAGGDGWTGIARVRDMLGVSRKYAQALLERLDGEKELRREGDRHVPRRGA